MPSSQAKGELYSLTTCQLNWYIFGLFSLIVYHCHIQLTTYLRPAKTRLTSNAYSALKVNHVQIAFVGFRRLNVYMKSSLPKGQCICTTVDELFIIVLPGGLVYSD